MNKLPTMAAMFSVFKRLVRGQSQTVGYDLDQHHDASYICIHTIRIVSYRYTDTGIRVWVSNIYDVKGLLSFQFCNRGVHSFVQFIKVFKHMCPKTF